jgi:hypothetical protein
VERVGDADDTGNVEWIVGVTCDHRTHSPTHRPAADHDFIRRTAERLGDSLDFSAYRCEQYRCSIRERLARLAVVEITAEGRKWLKVLFDH